MDSKILKETHYGVLGIERNANLDEIRMAYKEAILQYHPDKKHSKGLENDASVRVDTNCFIRIQEAWNVLKDPIKRKEYDIQIELKMAGEQIVANETVSVHEMSQRTVEGSTSILIWRCRCGGEYQILEEDLKDCEDILVPCDTCSLFIQVHDVE